MNAFRKNHNTCGNLLDTNNGMKPLNALSAMAFFLIAFLYSGTAVSQNDIKFERVSYEQGLFQSNITKIFQDRQGFLWIGTSDGLNRYDGYQFTPFRFDPFDSTSISGNNIFDIYEDRLGFLWINTSGGGINRYNPETGDFYHFRHIPDDPYSLSNDNVTCILEDRLGNFWLGTDGGGLNLFDRKNDQFVHFKNHSDEPASLSSNLVSVMYEDPITPGILWIGTYDGGLNYLPPLHFSLSEILEFGPDGYENYPRLFFKHYFAAGPSYIPDVFDAIEMLEREERSMSSILHPGNYQELAERFELREKQKFLMVCMGDGNVYGMSDFGWLEREDSDTPIWEMTYESSKFAGGSSRNRIQVAVLELTPGMYKLRFQSDQNHSFNKWVNPAPENLELWGIQIFSLDDETAIELSDFLQQEIIPNSVSNNWITDLHQDSDENLWIGTADGFSCLRRNSDLAEEFVVYKHDSKDPGSLNHSFVQSIYDGGNPENDALWIVTSEPGLNKFNRKTETVTRFMPPQDPTKTRSQKIGDSRITALLKDQEGKLWVGTASGGLNCLRPPQSDTDPESLSKRLQTNRPDFSSFRHDPTNFESISNNSITTIFEDRSGIIWIGTQQGGINKINRKKTKFRHYTANPDDQQSLSHKIVTTIFEDNDEILWVGTSGGGLNRLERREDNPEKFYYEHFRHDPGNPESISNDYVSAIFEDKTGNLWVGTSGGGLCRLFTNAAGEYIFQRFKFAPHTKNSITGNYINTIYEDQFGQLWIGTNSGLNKFDRFTQRFIQYRHDPNDPNSLSDNQVWAIYEDSYSQGKTLWIGTREGGINRYDRKNNQFINYTRDFDDPHSLNNPAILSIYQDQAGDLWFGTYSGGLNKFNRDTNQFTFFTERDGLSNNMIFGILEDRQNHLWLSTNKGLSKFNLADNSFKNYDVYDGLQSNQFNAGAYCLSRNGEMFFGGVNGINSFFPDSVKDNPHIPPIALTAFTIYDRPANDRLQNALSTGEPLRLSYTENFISIEFSALDFTNPAKNRYSYKLDGVNEGWIDGHTRRFASFTNLDPGTYAFHVKGANNDGIWNEEGASVKIVISPPFWKTWWFYLIAGSILFFSMIFLHNIRVRQKLGRVLEMEQVRMQENERVRTKAARDFHDELGHQLTKISLFSEILKRNLTEPEPEVVDYLNRIGENAKSLSGGTRDFIWTLDPGKDTLHEVGVWLKDFGDQLFDKTGVAFRVLGMTKEMDEIRLATDWRRHLVLIFKEAMHNSLKHSQGKNVTLNISYQNDTLEMTLSDDGKGFGQNGAARNGKAAEANRGGSRAGNGLTSMRARAKKLDGTVEILGRSGGGTQVKFTAKMPLSGN